MRLLNSAHRTATLAALENHSGSGADAGKLAIPYASNSLVAARALVDAKVLVAGEDLGYWLVQDLLLELKEQDLEPTQLHASKIPDLVAISAMDGLGAAEAQAWLELLGTSTTEVVILPDKNKGLRNTDRHAQAAGSVLNILVAYPNPASGPVFLTYAVMDGVERVEISIHDALGREVRRSTLAAQNGIMEIPARSLASGMHVASLSFDGIAVGSVKVEVIH